MNPKEKRKTKKRTEREREGTLRLGVKGLGSLVWRGEDDWMRLRSWMQFVGMTLHRARWFSHKKSGKSCSRSSRTRRVPLYSMLAESLSLSEGANKAV